MYDTERLFRVPDAVGNLFRTANRRDRKYGAGGRLLRSDEARYVYDDEGNLTEKRCLDDSRWLIMVFFVAKLSLFPASCCKLLVVNAA